MITETILRLARNQILLIFGLSFLVRIIKIQDYLFFGFEQGRDLLVIQQIYQLTDFVLVGPSTSIPGLFHGVWYYYLLALPLGVTAGNPLAASLFLIILGSFLPVVMYLLAQDMFRSKQWALVCGIVAIFSYEYILYSRWLSNVSLAPLFASLAFLLIWKYIKSRNSKFFLGFIISAGIATLFQMVLLVQFTFLVFLLIILRQLKLPSLKTVVLSILISGLLFGPMILFNFRNQNITLNSLTAFSGERADKGTDTIFSGLPPYLLQMQTHLTFSVVNIKPLPIQILTLTSICLGIWVFLKKRGERKVIILLVSWILMSLPLIIVSPGNPQYYAAIGLGWIMLFCLMLITFWESPKLKILSIIFMLLFSVGAVITVKSLLRNEDVFFRTSQDDLNLKHQREILALIEQDVKGFSYRLLPFTIPSLQPEGWQYLHSYYYPGAKNNNPDIVYIVVENNVYEVWEKKWIGDLGETNLAWEKRIGKLRLQKRELKNVTK